MSAHHTAMHRTRRPIVSVPVALSPREIDAVECDLRSGQGPDLDLAERLVLTIRGLQEAIRMSAQRAEMARESGR